MPKRRVKSSEAATLTSRAPELAGEDFRMASTLRFTDAGRFEPVGSLACLGVRNRYSEELSSCVRAWPSEVDGWMATTEPPKIEARRKVPRGAASATAPV